MKIRVEQLNPVIGDIEGNTELILSALKKSGNEGVDLLILPEMVLTGYPVQDLLESSVFRETCYNANQTIIRNSTETALLFGSLTPNKSGTGRKMFNSAILCKEGEKIGHINKTLLPTYDIFDDLRYFEPNNTFNCLELYGVKLGITVCEDIWYNQNEVQYHYYEINPAEELKKKGAQVLINISASPFTKNKQQNRIYMLRKHARELKLPVIYSNQAGAQADILFDGDSLVMDEKGKVVAITDPFEPGFVDVDWNPETGKLETVVPYKKVPQNKYPRVFEGIKKGIRDYLQKTGISDNVVLGLSGGIDSALVATLATEALGHNNVVALTMPSEYSSSGSISDSAKLAENLGIQLHEIPIKKIHATFNRSLDPLFRGTDFGVAEENIQSRIRGALLMAFSNKFGHMLLATGNKSELAVGYATLYGDMNGGLNPIGDLYKSEVYELSQWLNTQWYEKEIIPKEIIEKPPSAELRPGQKDTDSLPDYRTLDDILWRYLELQQEADTIIKEGSHEKDEVIRTLKMVDYNEFKRFQAPPILKLSSKSFGIGRRWPLVQRWTQQNSRK